MAGSTSSCQEVEAREAYRCITTWETENFRRSLNRLASTRAYMPSCARRAITTTMDSPILRLPRKNACFFFITRKAAVSKMLPSRPDSARSVPNPLQLERHSLTTITMATLIYTLHVPRQQEHNPDQARSAITACGGTTEMEDLPKSPARSDFPSVGQAWLRSAPISTTIGR